jgi:hypothetical protein
MGLRNAPIGFQSFMQRIFKEHMGKFVSVYLDDIIIYSRSAEEHEVHLTKVLEILESNGLYVKLKKCTFEQPEIKFLGHIVGVAGVKVDPAKVAVVASWPAPTNVKEVRSYCGLCNYFRKFIPQYASMVAPLTALTRKDVGFKWTQECQKAFDDVKQALITAPVLAMPDFSNPVEIEIICDASIRGIGAVLTQFGRPIAFESKKLSDTELTQGIKNCTVSYTR